MLAWDRRGDHVDCACLMIGTDRERYRGEHSPKCFQEWNFYRFVRLTTQEPSRVPVFHMTAVSGGSPAPPPLADPTPLFLPWSTTRRLSIIGGLSVQHLDQCVESARPSDLDRRCWRLLAGRGDGLLGHGGPRLCLEPRPPWRCIAERGPGPRGGLFDNLTQQANAGSSGAVPGKWAIWQAVGQMGQPGKQARMAVSRTTATEEAESTDWTAQ